MSYAAKRAASLVPVFLVISVIIFLLIHLTPGDPAAMLIGIEATAEDIAALNAKMGFDRPLLVQYLSWMGNLLRGDFGYSFFMQQNVTTAIKEHLFPTLLLSFIAQGIAIVVAIPSGIIAAKWRGSVVDGALRTFSLLGSAIPGFLLGLFLMLLFAVHWRLLPVAGYAPLSAGLGASLRYMILPAVSLSAVQTALLLRMTRSSMLDVLYTNYIKTARAKGLGELPVLLKHVFRNAALPVLTAAAQSFGSLITGAVVTESLFNIPGLGQLVLNAIKRRDFVVIQGVVLFAALLYALVNLVTDLLYGVIDPRVRQDFGEARS